VPLYWNRTGINKRHCILYRQAGHAEAADELLLHGADISPITRTPRGGGWKLSHVILILDLGTACGNKDVASTQLKFKGSVGYLIVHCFLALLRVIFAGCFFDMP
jgi:hypothetical protein